MLSEKVWKSDAVARLLISVFLCVYCGTLLVTGIYSVRTGKDQPVVLSLLVLSLSLLLLTVVLLRKPLPPEQLFRRLVPAAGAFYFGMAVGFYAQKLAGPPGNSVLHMIVAGLSFQGAALVLVRNLLREHQASWAEAFGFRNDWQRAVLIGLVVALLFLPVAWVLQGLSAWVMTQLPQIGLKPIEQETVQTMRQAASWIDRATLGLVTVVLAPIAEEVLFRGVIYSWIKHAGFPRLAFWGTAVLFAAIHLNFMTFLPLLLLALLLTRLYERTNNLLAPIAAHALFNAMNFVLLYRSIDGAA